MNELAHDDAPIIFKAAEDNYHQSLEVLLDAGADVNSTTEYVQTTPLHAVFKYHTSENQLRCLKVLIRKGVNVNMLRIANMDKHAHNAIQLYIFQCCEPE